MRTLMIATAIVLALPVAACRAQSTNATERPKANTEETELRTWTSTKGAKIIAEFMRVSKGKVILKKADGKTTAIPILRLSEKDREFVEQKTGDNTLVERTRTFAAGKVYFIWREDDEPVTVSSGGFTADDTVDFRFKLNPSQKPKPFAMRAVIIARKAKKPVKFQTTSLPDKDAEGDNLSASYSPPEEYDESEEGIMKLFLLNRMDKDKGRAPPISNVLDVPVEFK